MTLKELIRDWKKYSEVSEDPLPIRILNSEKTSIQRAVRLKLKEGDEEVLSDEDQKVINEILNFVEVVD